MAVLLVALAMSPRAIEAAPTDSSTVSAPSSEELDRLFEAEPAEDLSLFDTHAMTAQVIESIDVIGNDKTTKDTILRRVGIAAGSIVDDDQLEAGRLHLLGTGYFRAVEFSLERGSRRGLVVLVIEVEERNTITIDGLYYGGSSVSPFFGGLGVLESNFLGRGVSTGAAFVLGRIDGRSIFTSSYPT